MQHNSTENSAAPEASGASRATTTDESGRIARPQSNQTASGAPAANPLRFAYATCLTLGCAMILWGLASALAIQAATGSMPTLPEFFASGFVMFVGAIFLGFFVLIRRGVRWALASALVCSGSLFLITVGVGLVLQTHVGNSYLIVLSFVTTVSCWLGLEALNVPLATSLRAAGRSAGSFSSATETRRY